MSQLATVFSFVALLISVLALYSYQWVTFLPQLGIEILYHIGRIRAGIAIIATLLAVAGWWLAPDNAHLIQLVLVVALIPFSGFFAAKRVLVAVDSPRHVQASAVPLSDGAIVLGIDLDGMDSDGTAHAWAVETLLPHHLVNDEVDRRPVVATW